MVPTTPPQPGIAAAQASGNTGPPILFYGFKYSGNACYRN